MSILDDDLILEVLQKATTDAVGASDMPTLPVKYVGRAEPVKLPAPDDQKWLELIFIPNNRNGDFWGEEKNYRGMFRLLLHWPNDDSGAYEPMRVLKSVCAYFTKDLRLQNVQIYETPNLTAVLEQGKENIFPASMRYQSFRK